MTITRSLPVALALTTLAIGLAGTFVVGQVPGARLPSNPAGGPNSPVWRPLAGGGRTLAVGITEPQNGDWVAGFDLTLNLGSQATSLLLAWDDLETSPGVFAPTTDWLGIANGFYPLSGTKLALTITTIDTNVLRVPADLAGLPLNDPQVISRFNGLLDWVFSKISALELSSLSIGNEIDAYLGGDALAWSEYEAFFAVTSAHARGLRNGLLVGATATFGGYMTGAPLELTSLNQHSDVVLVTYYPLHPDFTVRPPSSVRTDMDQLTAAFPGRRLHLSEAGYPSSSTCASSDALQAQFVRQMFRAWDEHSESIRFIQFEWLHDLSQAEVTALGAYYGISSPAFLEYLRTLGLRTFSGTGLDKPGIQALRNQARLRGW